jgi:hypothetical protein
MCTETIRGYSGCHTFPSSGLHRQEAVTLRGAGILAAWKGGCGHDWPPHMRDRRCRIHVKNLYINIYIQSL